MPTETAATRSGNPAKRAAAKKAATPATPSITIDAEPKKKVNIKLIGQNYSVNMPKASLAIRITQQARSADQGEKAFESLNTWMDAAFGARQVAAVRKRLDDPDDDLDLDHIMQLMNALLEAGSGNPTT
jgi:hypothetical protein